MLADPVGPAGWLALERFEDTMPLAEAAADPWTVDNVVKAGEAPFVMNLRLRPARCDAHAVAEDNVGTLLPVRVAVGMRSGQLKLAAGATLRGQLYDFVTKACAAGRPDGVLRGQEPSTTAGAEVRGSERHASHVIQM